MRISKKNISELGFYYCIFYSLTRACLGAEFGQYPFFLFLGLMGIYIVLYFFEYGKQIQKITKTYFYAGFALYMYFILLNFILAKHSYSYGLYEYVFYLMMFFAVCHVFNNSSYLSILYFYELVGIILSIEAIWEFFTGNLPYRVTVEEQVIRRACGLLGTPLTLGIVMACISLVTFYLFTYTKKKVHLLCFILCIFGLLSTQSRGPLVSFIVSFIFMLCLLEYKRTEKIFNTVLKNIFRILFVGFVLFLIIAFLDGRNEFITTIVSRVQTITMWSGQDASNALRRQRWELGLQYFLQNPIIGYGISSTGTHSITGINVESGIIKKLVETGLVGFVLYYVTFGITTIKSVKRCMIKKTNHYPIASSVILAIFIENMVLQSIEYVAVFLMFIINFTYLLLSGEGKFENEQ